MVREKRDTHVAEYAHTAPSRAHDLDGAVGFEAETLENLCMIKNWVSYGLVTVKLHENTHT